MYCLNVKKADMFYLYVKKADGKLTIKITMIVKILVRPHSVNHRVRSASSGNDTSVVVLFVLCLGV